MKLSPLRVETEDVDTHVVNDLDLGAFTKLRKATVSFVMSVCPSRFLMDRFS